MVSPPITVMLGHTVADAIGALIQYKISGMPVLDATSHLLSIVTEYDLMKFSALEGLNATLGSVAKKLPKREDLVVAYKDTSFKDVFKLFLLNPIRRIPVIDDADCLHGIIARRDVLKAFYGHEGPIQSDSSDKQ